MTDVTKTCRDVSELLPVAQTAIRLFFQECYKANVHIFISETYRSQERQSYLYAQGRTRKGNIVTWTLNSYHKSRLAWDIGSSQVNGNTDIYNSNIIKKAGAIATKLGIEWGGNWKDNLDYPHMQVSKDWTMPKGYKLEGNVIIPTNSKEKIQLILNSTNKEELTLSQYNEIKQLIDAQAKEIKELKEQLNNKENSPSAWAKEFYDWAVNEGLTDGSVPKGYLSREQSFILLKKFYDKYIK